MDFKQKPPCGQSGLSKENNKFLGLSNDLIIAENRPAVNYVFRRCYQFLNVEDYQREASINMSRMEENSAAAVRVLSVLNNHGPTRLSGKQLQQSL